MSNRDHVRSFEMLLFLNLSLLKNIYFHACSTFLLLLSQALWLLFGLPRHVLLLFCINYYDENYWW